MAIILFSLQPERFYSVPRKNRWLISFYNDRATYKKNSYCSGLGKYNFKNLINFQLFDVCMAETSLSGMRPDYHSANIVVSTSTLGTVLPLLSLTSKSAFCSWYIRCAPSCIPILARPISGPNPTFIFSSACLFCMLITTGSERARRFNTSLWWC